MPRRNSNARPVYRGEQKKGRHRFDFMHAMRAGAHRAVRHGAAPPPRLVRLLDAE